MVVNRTEGRGIAERLVKVYKLAIKRWISSGDLMPSLVIIVNNTLYITPKLLRDETLNVLITKKKWCDVVELQAKLQAKVMVVDFLGGPVVKTLPANAGNTGLIPGPGRFHILQLNLCTTTTEPTCLEPVLRKRRSHCKDKPVHCRARVASIQRN